MSKQSSTAVVKAYQKAEREEVRDLARAHTKDSIDTLVRLMKGQKTPAGVKRQCAMDILSQGWGRPDSRSDSGGVQADKRGLTINILKLSTNTVEQIQGNGDVLEVGEAMDMARMINEGTEEGK